MGIEGFCDDWWVLVFGFEIGKKNWRLDWWVIVVLNMWIFYGMFRLS